MHNIRYHPRKTPDTPFLFSMGRNSRSIVIVLFPMLFVFSWVMDYHRLLEKKRSG